MSSLRCTSIQLASFCLCKSASSCTVLSRPVLSISSSSRICDMTCRTSSLAAAAAAAAAFEAAVASVASRRPASRRSCSGLSTAGKASCFTLCCSRASRMSRSSCSWSAIFFLKSNRGAAGRVLRSGRMHSSGSPRAAVTSDNTFKVRCSLTCPPCSKGLPVRTSSNRTSSTSSSAAERLLGVTAVRGACTRRDSFGSLAVRGAHRTRVSVGLLPLSTLTSPSPWMLLCVAGANGCLLGLEVVVKGSLFTPSLGFTFSLPHALQAI
mmetsp:Transcript_46695/g.108848  ORF Transcript_46695/g.108848 Transcript_46695/m.108848 type:complete len:266 (+) Transcript_46695:2062-2859(+)